MTSDVLLIDGSNLAHRMKVIDPLEGPNGERVEIVLGLLRTISMLLRENPTKEVFFCWDDPGAKDDRLSIFPDYKKKDKDEYHILQDSCMVNQVRLFWNRFGTHLPLTWVSSSKYEADDLIAILAHASVDRNEKALIYTNDKDMLQLVCEQVSVLRPLKPPVYVTQRNFEEYTEGYQSGYGYMLGRTLAGDGSDHIQGVPKIGPKTALDLLIRHGWSLNNLLDNPDEKLKKSKASKALLESRDIVFRNLRLMSLHLPHHHKPDTGSLKVKRGHYSENSLKVNLTALEFFGILTGWEKFSKPFTAI